MRRRLFWTIAGVAIVSGLLVLIGTVVSAIAIALASVATGAAIAAIVNFFAA